MEFFQATSVRDAICLTVKFKCVLLFFAPLSIHSAGHLLYLAFKLKGLSLLTKIVFRGKISAHFNNRTRAVLLRSRVHLSFEGRAESRNCKSHKQGRLAQLVRALH